MMILTSGHNLQDAPYPPRINQKRWRTEAVLMGKMTSSGKDYMTNIVSNDDTLCTPSLCEGSTNRWGILDWEDNHFFLSSHSSMSLKVVLFAQSTM